MLPEQKWIATEVTQAIFFFCIHARLLLPEVHEFLEGICEKHALMHNTAKYGRKLKSKVAKHTFESALDVVCVISCSSQTVALFQQSASNCQQFICCFGLYV